MSQFEIRAPLKLAYLRTMTPNEVRFRLLRSNDIPATNPHNLAYLFGLQDSKGNIIAGTRLPNGALCFDFSLKVKEGADSEHPVFTGPFASGPVTDRFVYLSWWAIDRGDWINRLKARLATIDWKMVRNSQQQGRPITADMTGRGPGDTRKYVSWYLE
jgi:hypothetical protein